ASFGMIADELAAAAPARLRKAAMPAPMEAQARQEPALPAALDVELLAYGRLRMPAATESNRGALVATSVVSLYLESVASMDLRIDVFGRIRLSTLLASSMEGGPPAGHELAQRTGDFDYAYRAASPVDVPSDGAFHVVQVGAYAAEAKMRHVTVPRESQDV